MSTLVFKDCYLSINGVALSDHVQSVTLEYSADEVEDTNMGDNTHKFMPSTLKNWSLEAEFSQDYAANEVDATLFGLIGGSAVAIEIRPTTSAASATNPAYQGNGVVLNYNPISGSVGEKKLASCTVKPSGGSPDLVRAVA